eukprot:1915845-Rhodomonas_salina.1
MGGKKKKDSKRAAVPWIAGAAATEQSHTQRRPNDDPEEVARRLERLELFRQDVAGQIADRADMPSDFRSENAFAQFRDLPKSNQDELKKSILESMQQHD